MTDELFYVGIQDPAELRKDLLTSSKNIIDSLRRYERYRELKEAKTENIMHLKRVFDELLVLNKKLRMKLPKAPVRVPEENREIPRREEYRPSRTHIDVLEEELSKIEQRLGSLE